MERTYKNEALAHWQYINIMAARRFGAGPLAEQAALAVMDGLARDDWARLRAYRGDASFRGFLRAVISSGLEDFARQKFGRLRPPVWVVRLGGIWEKLYVALCQQRFSLAEATEVVLQRALASRTSKEEVEEAACQLLARIPGCGVAAGEENLDEHEEMVASKNLQGADVKAPANATEIQQRDQLFAIIFELVLGLDHNGNFATLGEKFKELQIELQPDERLLLKLCYQDELGITEAGRLLGLNRFQVHGRMRRLLKRLHREFERVGLAQELKLLLEDA